MTSQEIFEHLKVKFGDAITGIVTDKPVDQFMTVSADKIDAISYYLRDYEDFQFDELSCLSGVDYADGTLGVTYHLYSLPKRHKLILKVIVPKDKPNVRTVSEVWATAIIFDGHKDLRRILLDDDWVGHPLRKDFEVPEFYHGMKVPY
jgi:NADH-quinone oxidoreductase subunit C